jgi:two-component system, sensor histidine kinase PdtaS
LGEKEWLVKEIHHRVKNNLQIVISLLRTQADHLAEGDALAAIHESESRLQVISLLHQKLYKVETDSSIDMKMYVPDLVNCILEGTDASQHLRFDVSVDNIKLDIAQAVPVGLILNEAITNAIKYAYPHGQHGTVRVYLQSRGDDNIILGVADNGQGLPRNFEYHNLSSMGMKLMETLAEQLEGTMDLRSNGGTTLEIAFKLNSVLSQSGVEHTTAIT